MKKLFVLLVAILPFLSGCGIREKEEHIMRLQADSLRFATMVAERDSSINMLFQWLNEIEENLAVIRAKEALVAEQATGVQEVQAEVKERITQNIQDISNLLDRNRELIDRLNGQVRRSNLRIADLNKTIERINNDMAEREAEIVRLKEQVAQLNIKVETLNVRVADLEKEGKAKSDMIDQKTIELNKAWYIVGVRRDLRDRGIINREGGFIGIGRVTTPAEDLIRKEFTAIDLRNVTEIPVNAKRAELVTVHPVGSYEFVGTEPVEKLVIKNPQEFWKASKYLVIVVR